ncbi:MAG: NfeD family protein [Chloroflexota bacterium]
MFRRIALLVFLVFVNLAPLFARPAQAAQDAPLVMVLTADGPVAQPMVEYLSRGLRIAEERRAQAVIVALNTPGGNVDAMTAIVQAIRASTVPVIVYVTPRGGMAASAGTLITLAGHASAMAPETTIGAASPVGGQGEDLGQTMATKLKEDMKATVRTLMVDRPPEAIAFAESTIEEARAATAFEALEIGLIDFVAVDTADLLQQLDGKTVQLADGPSTLQTGAAVLEPVPPLFIEELLQVLTNPNIVFLLITIGAQAILIELSSPGGWIAGFIGVVCLALATYGLGVLPVNWFGMIFLVMAFVLLILEIKTPTYGALSVAGIVSLIVGGLVLFNSPGTPDFQKVSVPLVVATSLVMAAVFLAILAVIVRAHRTPVLIGQESMSKKLGIARTEITGRGGNVQVGGELWSACLDEGQPPISAESPIEVVRAEGVRLIVRKPTNER